jgi:hypothetical protein
MDSLITIGIDGQYVLPSGLLFDKSCRFLGRHGSPPPQPRLPQPPDDEGLAALEAQYRAHHATYMKLRRRLDGLLEELRGLRDAVHAASSRGDMPAAERLQRDLWLKGACHFCLLNDWRKALQGLGDWLRAARDLATAAAVAGEAVDARHEAI